MIDFKESTSGDFYPLMKYLQRKVLYLNRTEYIFLHFKENDKNLKKFNFADVITKLLRSRFAILNAKLWSKIGRFRFCFWISKKVESKFHSIN